MTKSIRVDMNAKVNKRLKREVVNLLKTGMKNHIQARTILYNDTSYFPSGGVRHINSVDALYSVLIGYGDCIWCVRGSRGIQYRILDADALAIFLGIMTPAQRREAITRDVSLSPETLTIMDCVRGYYQDTLENEIIAYKIINAFLDTGFSGDIRTQSVSIFPGKDASKILERMLPKVCRILAHYQGCTPQDIEHQMGLMRYAHPVLVSGALNLTTPHFTLLGHVMPYVGLSVDSFPYLKAEDFVGKKVITIENKTSFERWCRERMDDDVIAVFTHGFPSSAVLSFLRCLDCPVYHWGDIDIGGILIASMIAKELGKVVSLVGWGPLMDSVRSKCDYTKDARYANVFRHEDLLSGVSKDYVMECLKIGFCAEQETCAPGDVVLM